VRLWWDLQIAEAPDIDNQDGAFPADTDSPHEHLPLKTAPLQALYLEFIRRHAFNAYEGEVVFAGLLEVRDLWSAALLDCLTVNYELQGELLMLYRLRGIPQSRLVKHDTLYILAKSQEAANILAAQDWASEPGIVHPNRVNKFVEFSPEQCLVTIWWD
jgi:hypothetical protein